MHEFWGTVGFVVNTIVFVMSGHLIVTSIGSDPGSHFWEDAGYGLLMWVLMSAYRALVMFGVIPLFRSSMYGYDWRDALVLSWGGLRGAVGLGLAVA
eukprot:5326552-Prymnesium_polylepis.1